LTENDEQLFGGRQVHHFIIEAYTIASEINVSMWLHVASLSLHSLCFCDHCMSMNVYLRHNRKLGFLWDKCRRA